jgi:PHD/YefM family antitoxin component YafN of YafNO toxin-antitoxin module
MTERKKELIIASRTEGQQEAAELAEALNRHHEPVVLAMKEVVAWVRQAVQGKVYDTDLEIRKAMKEGGVIWYEERFLIGGRLQHAAMNKSAYETLKSKHSLKSIKNNATMVREANEEQNETTRRKSSLFDDLRSMAKPPGDIFGAAL